MTDGVGLQIYTSKCGHGTSIVILILSHLLIKMCFIIYRQNALDSIKTDIKSTMINACTMCSLSEFYSLLKRRPILDLWSLLHTDYFKLYKVISSPWWSSALRLNVGLACVWSLRCPPRPCVSSYTRFEWDLGRGEGSIWGWHPLEGRWWPCKEKDRLQSRGQVSAWASSSTD
jgi:hypothetical protein